MKTILKYFAVAFLSVTSGIAFAYPLFYAGYVQPLGWLPDGPKPDLKFDVAYANFTLQPYDPNTPIPNWYDAGHDGQPSFLSFDLVTNITNYSNRTALITPQLSFCVGNSSTSFLSVFKTSPFNSTVRGLWLDGEWMNVTWVPQRGHVPAHWREGVDIERTFVMGNLTEVHMSINGSWVDVTDRVRLLEKDTIMPMSDSTVMTQIIASGEIRFCDEKWHPGSEMPWHSVTNVDLTAGFDNRWLPDQSRLIMLKGTLPVPPKVATKLVEWLNSNLTLVRITTFDNFEDDYFDGVRVNTFETKTVFDTITLATTPENHSVYNKGLGENQMFQLDSFGVEAFIRPRS